MISYDKVQNNDYEYDNEKGHAGTSMMRTLSSEDMETLQ